ncbi:MAG: hypothetical protein EOO68_33870 [Moraxellaceae bacterium]|nr:MAG: hypothetical protein EOO68_33870 [Moraxellaceae bacterium]
MSHSSLTSQQKLSLEANALKPFGSNSLLKELFHSVTKVLIKKGGVYNDKALGCSIDFTIDDPNKILELLERLEIAESNIENYCMCLGDYALEIYANTELKATLGLHHGTAIRYERWKGDLDLKDGKSLIKWLGLNGYSQPLIDLETQRK